MRLALVKVNQQGHKEYWIGVQMCILNVLFSFLSTY